MPFEEVKCTKCFRTCISDTETRKFGRRTMKRTTYRCQFCESPMGGKLIVKAGNWVEK